MREFLDGWAPRVLSVLRIIVGFLFLWHGSQKLFGFPPTQQTGGEVSAFMIFAGILEFFGGFLILIGLFTRWTAFILCGMMAVAYWMVHGTVAVHQPAFLPLVNRGELAALYCFVFLYLFFAGGGAWSVDNLIGRNKFDVE